MYHWHPYKEQRRGLGLVSHILFRCSMYAEELSFSTVNPKKQKSVVIDGRVWSTIGTGCAYSSTEELPSSMDILALNKVTFYKMEREFEKVIRSK